VTITEARRLSGIGNTKIWERSGQKIDTVVGRRKLVVLASLEQLLSPEVDAA
jgi:hypothetical protein